MECQDYLLGSLQIKQQENTFALLYSLLLRVAKKMRDQLQRTSILHSTHGLLSQARYLCPSLCPPQSSPLLVPSHCSLFYSEYLFSSSRPCAWEEGWKCQELGSWGGTSHIYAYISILLWALNKTTKQTKPYRIKSFFTEFYKNAQLAKFTFYT